MSNVSPEIEDVKKFKSLSLRKNFSWNLVGNIVYAGCQWGIMVVLAKLTSPEMVGQFALGLAVTAPFILFSQLQLRAAQATDAKDEYCFSHYLGLRIITTSIAIIIITIIAICFYEGRIASVIMIVGLSKIFESFSDVFYGLMQKYERMDMIAISLMIKGPLLLLNIFFWVFLTGDVLWGLVGMATVSGVIFFAFDVRNGLNIMKINSDNKYNASLSKPIFLSRKLKNLAWLTLPLGLVTLLLSLNTNIPRYFIEKWWGQEELGVFAALSYLIAIGVMVVSAIGQSATPRLAKYYAKGEIKQYRNLLFKMLFIGFILAFGGIFAAIVAGETVVEIIYNADYAKQNIVFILIMIGGGISYIASFCGYGVTAARMFNIQLPICIAVLCCMMITSYILIPEQGLYGSAIVLLISSAFTAIVYGVALWTAMRKIAHKE